MPSSSTTIARTPPAVRRTVHLRGAGVERVVHQLAHHRGRALHHLAGGDLADQFVRQLADGAARRGGDERIHRRIVGSASWCRGRTGFHGLGIGFRRSSPAGRQVSARSGRRRAAALLRAFGASRQAARQAHAGGAAARSLGARPASCRGAARALRAARRPRQVRARSAARADPGAAATPPAMPTDLRLVAAEVAPAGCRLSRGRWPGGCSREQPRAPCRRRAGQAAMRLQGAEEPQRTWPRA